MSVGGKGFSSAYQKLLNACHVQHAAIADLDYVEQIGTRALKSLFRVNPKEIKERVIQDQASRDGTALVAAIEEAIANGNWDHARATWNYIKSHRRRLPRKLTPQQRATLNSFLEEQRNHGIFVLSRGTLETYLPPGHAGKDLDKLIRFVSRERFWDQIKPSHQRELKRILKRVCAPT